VLKWPFFSQNRKSSDLQAELNDLEQKADLQQACRPNRGKSDWEITIISLQKANLLSEQV
jgi:hypothetical protein